MRLAFLFYGSLTSLGSLFIYMTSINVPINIDFNLARIYTVAVVAIIVVLSLRTLFSLLFLPGKSLFLAVYILIVNVCIAVPVAFAALFRVFQRTGECIMKYEKTFDDLHFSYTTLTTLGYGDLSPLG